jgi:hypothetical protein
LELTIASLLDASEGEEATTAEVASAMASLSSLARGIAEGEGGIGIEGIADVAERGKAEPPQ